MTTHVVLVRTKMAGRQILLCCCVGVLVDARSLFPRLGLRDPPTPIDAKPPEAQWFDQMLDHFGGAQGTWKQRYFVNDTYWSKGSGPVFLMLGGEGEANPAWIYADTDVMKNARKYNAMVVLLEHR